MIGVCKILVGREIKVQADPIDCLHRSEQTLLEIRNARWLDRLLVRPLRGRPNVIIFQSLQIEVDLTQFVLIWCFLRKKS